MSRIVRYAVGLAVVLAMSAQVAQAAAPDHLRWKGQDVNQIGPMHGPMMLTRGPGTASDPGGLGHRPAIVTRVMHVSGGNGFDWTAALVGAGSAAAILLLAGGATAGVRSRRGVAIS